MLRPLARVIGFLGRRRQMEYSFAHSRFEDPFQQRARNNEISEYDGILLVRLGRGSAMQLRLEADRTQVSFRVVPIARATQVSSETEWQMASYGQLEGWLQADSAIGTWLLAKGLRLDGNAGEKFAEHLAASV